MFPFSKRIYNPKWRMPNYVGRTVGLTVHTPKFWNCHAYDFYTSQFDEMYTDDSGHVKLDDETKEHRYQAKRAHAHCKRRHMSNAGYAYWTGPKRRYEFRYMGPTHPRDVWWKPVSILTHRQYVRWRDNGPQSPPVVLPDRSEIDAIFGESRVRFAAAIAEARAQMDDYERMRDAQDA